jgi:ubiquitin-like 1-activating enzyme E1 A
MIDKSGFGVQVNFIDYKSPTLSMNGVCHHYKNTLIYIILLEAQSRIQSSRVLICGLSGLHIEVVKNIVLAGMHVVIQDSGVIHNRDLASNYFVTAADVGLNAAEASLPRIRQLNTFTTVEVETRPLSQLDDNFFRQFGVVLLNDIPEVLVNAMRHNEIL